MKIFNRWRGERSSNAGLIFQLFCYFDGTSTKETKTIVAYIIIATGGGAKIEITMIPDTEAMITKDKRISGHPKTLLRPRWSKSLIENGVLISCREHRLVKRLEFEEEFIIAFSVMNSPGLELTNLVGEILSWRNLFTGSRSLYWSLPLSPMTFQKQHNNFPISSRILMGMIVNAPRWKSLDSLVSTCKFSFHTQVLETFSLFFETNRIWNLGYKSEGSSWIPHLNL